MEVLAAAAAAAAPPAAAAAPDDAPDAAGPRRLTELQRYSCVALHKDGRSCRYIAKHLGVNDRTVRAVISRFNATGSPGSGSRSGRPRCTDEALDTAIAFTARVDKFTSPRQIRRKLELEHVSPRTIDRRLQEAGLFGRVARKKRDYSAEELRKRMAFAQGYGSWTVAQWEKVLFSDEKCFYGHGFCGRVWVRRPKGEALNPDYCVHKVAHAVKINVWACFAAGGQGYCHIFNEKLDKHLYKRILSANLIPSARLHFAVAPPRLEQWHFLHDNDPKHTSGVVKEWLHNSGVSVLDFPPYSPDLNPIENLWCTMQRAVEKHAATTMEELQEVIAAEWDKVDADYMRKLVHSMPARCQAVIDANGWHTKY
jgi:transposase